MSENLVFEVEELETSEQFFSPEKADWAIEKIKEERERSDVFISVAKDKIERLNLQIQEEESRRDNRISELMYQLDNFLDSVNAKVTKAQKSFVLPAGKLVRKFPKLDFEKDEKVLTEKLQGTSYVEQVSKLKWAELKKDLSIQGDVVINTATGEIVEGVTVIEKPGSFDVA